MPQSFVSLHCHIVFSTKNRFAWIEKDIAPRLYDYFGGILRDEGACLVAAGGMPDHVHLLASLGRERSIADTLRMVKAGSSRWVHQTFSHLRGFAWQSGYGTFAVSFSALTRVRQYVDSQEEHHRVRTFQEEFLALLQKHNIPYDEEYIWQ